MTNFHASTSTKYLLIQQIWTLSLKSKPTLQSHDPNDWLHTSLLAHKIPDSAEELLCNSNADLLHFTQKTILSNGAMSITHAFVTYPLLHSANPEIPARRPGLAAIETHFQISWSQ
jgi:hypothetical protein